MISPYSPPMAILAFNVLIEIWTDPDNCPKLRREYQARNSVTRSVSPHRIRPIHASQADSS
ncbi:Uncharacterised protein [Mycobacterium tuberculosis]|uniref:Uncharacterized protein n=2 Tax=Mycobacterium tuberculosis TaxID=1773 RepID=A0A0T9ELE2_MYCTX|nr:Uncharacterised protein [Mycobacterium tuberculosis]CFE50574.1 Uncharacterised protein [Mycobacterium tuberculosis]CFR65986.1 Uncharacterised protein [Mycobacterium tuberculosis]CFR81376.1 Uncharacterised protein [Mycobacterium tuberculosis]CFS37913.1 Uncharacterised protein [Mycobacterium tuberculosis]